MKFLTLIILYSASLAAQTNKQILDKLVKEEKQGAVIKIFDIPTSRNLYSAEYVFSETKLSPGEILYFHVPEDYAKLNFARLGFSHRQKGEFVERDLKPGLTSALVYSKSVVGDEFRYWGGPSSGEFGAKFAENSQYPEYDALYEWPKKGHRGLKNSKKVFDLITANVIRLQNTGVDNVYLSKLNFEFIPKVAVNEDIEIFTSDSNFGDPETMAGRVYGGGQRHRGTYPNAITLNSKYEYTGSNLPHHYSVAKNRLEIDISKNNKFSFIEIMCGDSRPDGVINRDGGYGSPGNAEVNITIENSLSGEQRILAKNIGIPPEGVIMISEVNDQVTLKKGDRLVITNKANKSTLYIMAIRIGFSNDNPI